MNFIKKYRRKKRDKQERKEAIKRKLTALTARYQDYALNRNTPGVEKNPDFHLVVSLTTFSKRIDDVYLTIESLFQQSRKADKIVLWLSKEEFTENDVPAILRKQCERGLEIEFCDKNLRSYKKFYYALQKYPDSLILTVDDDVLYPLDMIDQLCRAYRKEPGVVHCQRAHRITLDSNGNVLPYREWEARTDDVDASPLVFPTGIGGVLYFPGCFDPEVLNESAFVRLAPYADDVWLKAMSLKKGVLCKRIPDERDWWQRYLILEESQKYSLKRQNKRKDNGNDVQLKAVFDQYDLWKSLR